jgi:hypothetical protein
MNARRVGFEVGCDVEPVVGEIVVGEIVVGEVVVGKAVVGEPVGALGGIAPTGGKLIGGKVVGAKVRSSVGNTVSDTVGAEVNPDPSLLFLVVGCTVKRLVGLCEGLKEC